MVNRGRSGGCITCKKRHVKCDEGKPNCWRCRRLGVDCEGYKTELLFRDQNYKFSLIKRDSDIAVRGSLLVLPPSPSVPDSAVAFYLRHYADYGRDNAYARGFFEVLIPVYRSQVHDSALSHAVSALASLVLALWRYGSNAADTCRQPKESYGLAVVSLRRALSDQTQVDKSATLMAVLALQFYENIIAIFSFRLAARTHHDGALSLLDSIEPGQMNAMVGAYVRKFVVHVEVSSAMRRKRPVRDTANLCLRSKVATAAPYNLSGALDNIVAAIAELQAIHLESSKRILSFETAGTIFIEAMRVDRQLMDWARSIPPYWKPLTLVSGRDFDASIPNYIGICDNYSSCQVANIWNLWRLQRLTLVKLMLGIVGSTSRGETSWPVKRHSPNSSEDLFHYQEVVQELVDSVCRSVPFYLGDRTAPSSMADFTDPDISLLGPPQFDLQHSKDATQDRDLKVPSDEHRRHIIAQGPWHIMSPLSRLLTLLSEDATIESLLQPGQRQWIRTQFLRVLRLLHMFPADLDSAGDITADFLAKQVRKGAVFMSGP
ncbi:hypothetical protein DE146DRAFT_757667 [Phaeosphaeria sp. MPI-PUGE-AT-0046c]|nr:hypothetical protein DE146DRAFT_757667 [Phaeosphaeria sp. MPI-PUGE-AT-0046c]